MHRILILSSAAIVLSACSMDGAGTYYDQSASAKGCVSCGPAGGYSVGGQSAYHSPKPAQHAGHNHAQSHNYAAQQPDAHAYGTHAPKAYAAHGGHHARGHHAPSLRGMSNARTAYKYGTLGAVMYDTDTDMYGIQGRLGYQSAKYIGAELEGSVGVIDDTETIAGTEFKAETDYSVGAFARALLPLGDRFGVFARGGYHATKISGSTTDALGTVEVSDTTDGFAYGAGAEFEINPRDSIRFDYTRYDLGGGETDSLALSYARKF